MRTRSLTFRRLARELHPDVSDEPDAEERFREAAEAYEVLSKAEMASVSSKFLKLSGAADKLKGKSQRDLMKMNQVIQTAKVRGLISLARSETHSVSTFMFTFYLFMP